jgi:hypothetical protein
MKIVDFEGKTVDPEAAVWVGDTPALMRFGNSRIVDAWTFKQLFPSVPIKLKKDGKYYPVGTRLAVKLPDPKPLAILVHRQSVSGRMVYRAGCEEAHMERFYTGSSYCEAIGELVWNHPTVFNVAIFDAGELKGS